MPRRLAAPLSLLAHNPPMVDSARHRDRPALVVFRVPGRDPTDRLRAPRAGDRALARGCERNPRPYDVGRQPILLRTRDLGCRRGVRKLLVGVACGACECTTRVGPIGRSQSRDRMADRSPARRRLPARLAGALARDTSCHVHVLLRSDQPGCSAELAARILAPLEGARGLPTTSSAAPRIAQPMRAPPALIARRRGPQPALATISSRATPSGRSRFSTPGAHRKARRSEEQLGKVRESIAGQVTRAPANCSCPIAIDGVRPRRRLPISIRPGGDLQDAVPRLQEADRATPLWALMRCRLAS